MAVAAARGGANRARALWFRTDLRVDDNPALHAACDGATSLLPLFVFDPSKFNEPTLAGARKSSARRARFLLESVACLRKRLEAAGSGLAIAVGQPHDGIIRLLGGCADGSCCVVTQSVCSEEQTDEARVAKSLKARSGELKKVWGGTMYMPNECGCQPDDTPLMFTQFKNKAEGRGRIRDPLEPPKKMPPLPEQPTAELQKLQQEALCFVPTLKQLGYTPDEAASALEDDPRSVLPFEGGEDAALARLDKWMFKDDKLKDYFEIRNGMLGEGYSSKLSPWLALGCISPRRVWKYAQRYEEQRVKNKSTYWLVFELTWRDFFIYMARSQGDKIFVQGGITGDTTPWKGSRESLARWKDGRTGDKLVDANMRELKATGFMSNRGRQNVASYLIFDLGVDWRFGAAHFEEYLLDYDPCSNWGNWVAAAGLTGQRVNKFNTKKQLNDYDPKRDYVRHWLEGAPAAPTKTSAVATADGAEEAKRQARMERFSEASSGKGSKSKGGKASSARQSSPDSEEAKRQEREARFASGGYPNGGKSGGKSSPGADRKKGRWRQREPSPEALGA